MAKFLRLPFALCLSVISFFLMVSCDSGSNQPASAAIAPSISVDALDGHTIVLQLDNKTDAIYMATWCPHSKALKQILKDPSMQPYLTNRKLTFLFGKEEWKQVESELKDMAKEGELPLSQVQARLSQLMRRSGSEYVFDPKFFTDLPGTAYYTAIPVEVKAYPTVRVGDSYPGTATWLLDRLGVPATLVKSLYEQYDK